MSDSKREEPSPNTTSVREYLASRPAIERDLAETIFTAWQAEIIFGVILAVVLDYMIFGMLGITAIMALVTTVYFLNLFYKAKLMKKSLNNSLVEFTHHELQVTRRRNLPTISVLVPLYREPAMLPRIIENILAVDYPKERIQILLLLETDDQMTLRKALDLLPFPDCVEVVLVPQSYPRTKPKACNVGLRQARGEYTVIFDAEDRMEKDQFLKAVRAFEKSSPNVVCVQAKLEYLDIPFQVTNPHKGVKKYLAWPVILAQAFTAKFLRKLSGADYATWFNLVLPGLAKSKRPVPLGGTSNYFKTRVLREIGAWDPFNVTEDFDLGVWIAREGLQVAVMDSVTWEEPTTVLGVWIKQHSRWVKGQMATYFVHMRHPKRLFADLGLANFLDFQFFAGCVPLLLVLNPLFVTLSGVYAIFRLSAIHQLYPLPVLYLGVVCLMGNAVFWLFTVAGCLKRGLDSNIKWVIGGTLIYWFLLSVASWKALYQLIRKPHYWEKTRHGEETDPESDSEDLAELLRLRLSYHSSRWLQHRPQRTSSDIFPNLKPDYPGSYEVQG